MWRKQSYRITAEPVAMAYTREQVAAQELARTHAALMQILRARSADLTGNVAPRSPADPALAQPPSREDLAHLVRRQADVATEWSAGLPVLQSADGLYTFKPRGRILADVGWTFGSDHDGRNLATAGTRALRLGLRRGAGIFGSGPDAQHPHGHRLPRGGCGSPPRRCPMVPGRPATA
ncbi:hypothetical protein [Novosphingobium sp. BW1]|uniref:hypothetical protein n=1 Tax=Novosphingobium sp. BW1 TaxID=2592621 RepID=UPI0011DEED7B|nr:hypothetical protein [Novosphingobium sp. BW1]TYC89688.1 hypothetical protein FMM79_09825 [Novosphingobium sp. BW1]